MSRESIEEKQKKVQKRTIESREKLLEAAFELFAEKGYYNTNTKEIVKRAGISIGNFYNYFKDKGDIYLALAKQYLEDSYESIKGIVHKVDELDREEAHSFFIEYFHNQLERASSAAHFFDDSAVIEKVIVNLADLIQEMEAQVNTVIEDYLRNHRKNTNNVSYPVMARMLYVTVNEVSCDIIKVKDKDRREEYILALTDFLVNYCYE